MHCNLCMIIKHDASQAFYVLSTQFRSQQMHAHWESCNKSSLWSMELEKAFLVDAIVVTCCYHSSYNIT